MSKRRGVPSDPQLTSQPVDAEVVQSKLNQPAQETQLAQKRVFKRTQKIVHDLYKLQVATMAKDVGFSKADPKYIQFEHTHIYHNVDSNGKPQETCAPVGGHFHFMTLESNGDGVPTVICGPPVEFVWQKKRGSKRPIRVAVPYDSNDTHVHGVEYIDSEELQPRKLSSEFVKYQAQLGRVTLTPAQLEANKKLGDINTGLVG